jgi:hypothetical protein
VTFGGIMKYYMSSQYRQRTTLVLFATVLWFTTIRPNGASSDTELGKLYLTCKTPEQRLQICIDAINEGVIAKGENVSVLRKIFGTHLVPPSFEKIESGKSGHAVVFLSMDKIVQNSRSHDSAALTGWYLYCYYDENEKIKNYYLTNSPFHDPMG